MERPEKTLIDLVYFLSRCLPEEISKIANEEYQKINSMSRDELLSYIGSETPGAFVWSIGFNFYDWLASKDGFDPDIFVEAVCSILVCIKSRLEMEWVSMERPLLMELPLGITSRTVMNTLEEIMSENIPTAQHTVFDAVHQYMKTNYFIMCIEKPIENILERPVTKFQNTVLQFQECYQDIVGYINNFEIHMQQRRRQYYQSLLPRPSPSSIEIPPSKQRDYSREYFD